jgi:hypothetical protein
MARALAAEIRFHIMDPLERAVPRSIVGWFIVCWCAFLLGSIVVATLLVSLYSQSTSEQLRRASAAITHGCDSIMGHYQYFVVSPTRAPNNLREPELARGLTGVVQNALRGLSGIEGGIWQAGATAHSPMRSQPTKALVRKLIFRRLRSRAYAKPPRPPQSTGLRLSAAGTAARRRSCSMPVPCQARSPTSPLGR